MVAVDIVIADTRAAVIRNLQDTLGTFAHQFRADRVRVHIYHGRVEDWDEQGVCHVNPGNCAGVMRGALDRALLALMPGVDKDVDAMVTTWGTAVAGGDRKQLPLFSALLTRSTNHRWLLTSTTMIHPGPANHRGTRNAFHATHAALSMLTEANRAGMGIQRVVMPGVCTGHGRMNRADAARQMADAFRAVFCDDNIRADPTQAAHPRLMIDPQ